MKYPTTNPSLLERVQDGDEISWNEFYHRYAPVIRCVGESFKFTEEERDDLTQMVMLKFFGAARHYVYREGEVKFRTYFARIVNIYKKQNAVLNLQEYLIEINTLDGVSKISIHRHAYKRQQIFTSSSNAP